MHRLLILIAYAIASFNASWCSSAARAAGPNEYIVYDRPPGITTNQKVVSNGPGEPGNPGFTAADDFQLSGDAAISRIEWWGEFNSISAYNFSFTFYSDAGGSPGTILHSTTGTLSTTIASPGSSFDPVEFYTSQLTSPFLTQSGQRYWLSVFNGAPGVRWEWLTANAIGNGSKQVQFSTTQWLPVGRDLAFRLFAVPEPMALTMAIPAMALVILSRGPRRA